MIAASLPLQARPRSFQVWVSHCRSMASGLRVLGGIPEPTALAHVPSPRARRMMRNARVGAW